MDRLGSILGLKGDLFGVVADKAVLVMNDSVVERIVEMLLASDICGIVFVVVDDLAAASPTREGS